MEEISMGDESHKEEGYSYNQLPPDPTNASVAAGVNTPSAWCVFTDHEHVFRVVLITMASYGLVTNLLSFVVLYKKYSANNVIFFLKSLCVSDSCFLVSALISMTTELIYPKTPFSSTATAFIFFTARYILADIALLVSAWLTVALAYSRYVGVAKPMETRMYSDKTRAWICTLVIFGAAGILEAIRIPLVMRCGPTEEGGSHYMCYPDYYRARNYYIDGVVFGGVYFLLPLAPLLGFSLGMVRTLRKVNRNRSPGMPSIQEESDAITRTVVAIVTVFILTYSTYFLWSLTYLIPPIYNYFWHRPCEGTFTDMVLYFASHVNASVNFIIYVAFNKSFRKNLCALFEVKKRLAEKRELREMGTMEEKITLAT